VDAIGGASHEEFAAVKENVGKPAEWDRVIVLDFQTGKPAFEL
jgi:hypothetical protein